MAELVTKYQQYAEYKDSGVEWLGEIPKDWQVVRLKYIAELSGNKTSGSANQYVGLENVESKTGKFKVTEGIVSEGVSNTFKKDNLLFGKLRPYLAKSWLASFSGICSSEFLVLDSKLVHPKFLKYMTLTDEFVEQVNSSTYGTKMPRASWDFIGLLPLPVMNYKLSKIIANFLDFETAQIDTLIEKQQILIKLLKEKCQAVISHAVTKGLNPDASMKDSGVEWLGEVPEHWNITRIKYVAELTPSKAKILPSLEKRCSFVPMEKLKLDTLILDETRKIKDVYQGYTYFEDGDVLIAKVTPCFENQNMAIAANLVNGIGFGSSEIYVLRTDAEGLNQFLLYRLQESVFMQLGTGAMTGAGGLRRVPSDFINDFQFALPSINEQQEIVAYIEIMKNTFNDLVSKAERAIQLMQERRTALISAAVTGKIDVRGWQAPE